MSEHIEHYLLPSGRVREYARLLYHRYSGKILSEQSLTEVLHLLISRARNEGAVYKTAIRSCHAQGITYVDLGQRDWRVIEITGQGWRIISTDQCPIRFLRPKGLLPLATPVAGGRIEDLATLLNVDEGGLVLCTAWMLSALSGMAPCPLMTIVGPQGSCKSTAAAILRTMIDPHKAERRRIPKTEHDLFISAYNSYVLSYENVSSLPEWLSDALCSIVTGGTYSARTLYTDTDETLMQVVRPVILNGIPDLLTRPDLADRAIVILLQRLNCQDRITEQALWERFEVFHPRILGALCDVLVVALSRMGDVILDHNPRMLDFAKLMVAAESGLPWTAGTFMKHYLHMQCETTHSLLSGEPLADALREWIDSRENWLGTPKELLAGLNAVRDPHQRAPNGWPTSARQLGSDLRRLRPALESIGYTIEELGRGTGGAYRYRLQRMFTTSNVQLPEE